MVVSGKAELNKSNWLKTEHMKGAPKIKRASSTTLDLSSLNDTVGIMYTSTPITVTKAVMYRETSTVGTTGALDVGINADDDCIVDAEALAATAIDTILECTIANGAVAAGKFVVASVETAVGTSGLGVIAIEYTEDN